MWHAARAQERKLRGIVVDHRKRAERKRAWTNSQIVNAFQMIRCVGTKSTIEINPVQRQYVETEKNLVPWTGDIDVLINRFDGRVHLDFISESQIAKKISSDELFFNFQRYLDIVGAKKQRNSKEHLELIEKESPLHSIKYFNFQSKSNQINSDSSSIDISDPQEDSSVNLHEWNFDKISCWEAIELKRLDLIGNVFSVINFVERVKKEIQEREEAKLKNNASSQFLFLEPFDKTKSKVSRKERRRFRKKKSPKHVFSRNSPLSYAKMSSPPHKTFTEDSSSETSDNPSESHVEYIRELTAGNPSFQEEPYHSIIEEKEEHRIIIDKKKTIESKTLSIREKMALKRQIALTKQLKSDLAKQLERDERKEEERLVSKDNEETIEQNIRACFSSSSHSTNRNSSHHFNFQRRRSSSESTSSDEETSRKKYRSRSKTNK